MSNQWKCIHCGQSNPEAMRFCPNCGKPRPEENASTVVAYAPPAANTPSAPRPGNKRKALLGAAIAFWGIGLLILIAGGLLWWSRSQKETEQITQATVQAAVAQTQAAQTAAESPAPQAEKADAPTPSPAPSPTPSPVWSAAYIDAGGNLWLTDAAGKERKQLTDDGNLSGEILWSPNGKFLLADRTLVDVEKQQITELADRAFSYNGKISNSYYRITTDVDRTAGWSADGKKLAYIAAFASRNGDGNYIPLKIIYPATGETETFKIAYQRDDEKDDYFPIDLFWQDDCCVYVSIGWETLRGIHGNQIYRLDVQSGKVQRVLADFTYLNGFSFSPNADTLLFAARKDTWSFNFDVYALASDSQTPQKIAVVNGNIVKTHWPADGDGFFVWSKAKDPHTFSEHNYSLLYVSWPQAEVTRLAAIEAEQGALSDPKIAPDGQAAAFSLYRKDKDRTGLYLLPAPQLEPQLLTAVADQADFNIAWAAGGQELWVTSPDAPEKAQVYNLQGQMTRETAAGPALAFSPAAASPSAALAAETTPAAASSGGISNLGAAVSKSGGDKLQLPDTAPVSSNAPIAFIQGGYHLFTIQPDGSNQQEIPLPTDGAYYPQWSPDGKRIAFDYSTLWIMDADGGNPQAVVEGNHPAWSPDERQLVFDRKHNTYIIDIATGEERLLAENYWYPAWSPDGQTISFYEVANGETDVYLINADGSNLRPLTQTPDIAEYVGNNSWSPDGKYLLIAAGEKLNDELGTPYSDNTRLEIIEVATGERRKVTDTEFTGSAAWSPDGKQIVFADYVGEGPSRKLQLFVVDVDGNNRRQLTSGANDSYAPTWGGMTPSQTEPSSAFAAILPPTPTPLPTPTPTPKPVVAAPPPPPPCPAPGAQITSPRPGAWFTKRYNYIIGTASIPRFHHWKIEYSTNPNGGGWQYLLERDYPVENDKLVMIDASTIPRGPYGLRLTVVEDTGNYPEPCEVWFTNGY